MKCNGPFSTVTLDALLPQEMARKAEQIGAEKTRLDTMRLLMLAILAGAFIAFGAMLATIAMAGADGALPYSMIRIISGVAFSLGLILVVVGGAELFTGNSLMVMAWASRKVSLSEVVRAWLVVYIGNFIGAAVTALLIFLSDHYEHGGSAIGIAALTVA